MPTGEAGVVDRFEVDLRHGTFTLRQSDLWVHDEVDVPLTRTYSSGEWPGANPSHGFGVNSNHPYDLAPLGTRNPYTYQELVLADGQTLFFDRVSEGTGFADAVYRHTETSTRFYRAVTIWNGDGWTTRLTDGSEIVFPESYAATNLAQGSAVEMRDAAGRTLHLRRDGDRNLAKILTPAGHWIRFEYDGQARITLAEDDRGQWTRYGYNASGFLVRAVHSSGRERHYEYDGTRMTEIADEHGRVLLRNRYKSGWLERQEYADGDVFEYSYVLSPNRLYAEKAMITLPDHSTRELAVAADVLLSTKWPT